MAKIMQVVSRMWKRTMCDTAIDAIAYDYDNCKPYGNTKSVCRQLDHALQFEDGDFLMTHNFRFNIFGEDGLIPEGEKCWWVCSETGSYVPNSVHAVRCPCSVSDEKSFSVEMYNDDTAIIRTVKLDDVYASVIKEDFLVKIDFSPLESFCDSNKFEVLSDMSYSLSRKLFGQNVDVESLNVDKESECFVASIKQRRVVRSKQIYDGLLDLGHNYWHTYDTYFERKIRDPKLLIKLNLVIYLYRVHRMSKWGLYNEMEQVEKCFNCDLNSVARVQLNRLVSRKEFRVRFQSRGEMDELLTKIYRDHLRNKSKDGDGIEVQMDMTPTDTTEATTENKESTTVLVDARSSTVGSRFTIKNNEYLNMCSSAENELVSQYTSRALPLVHFEWSTTHTMNSDLLLMDYMFKDKPVKRNFVVLPFDMMTRFSNNPQVMPFFQNSYFNGDFKVLVQLNANVRQFGRAIISPYYEFDYEKNVQAQKFNVYTMYQRQHATVDASSSKPVELDIPFRHRTPWIPLTSFQYEKNPANLVAISMRVLVPLAAATGTPTVSHGTLLVIVNKAQFRGLLPRDLVLKNLEVQMDEGTSDVKSDSVTNKPPVISTRYGVKLFGEDFMDLKDQVRRYVRYCPQITFKTLDKGSLNAADVKVAVMPKGVSLDVGDSLEEGHLREDNISLLHSGYKYFCGRLRFVVTFSNFLNLKQIRVMHVPYSAKSLANGFYEVVLKPTDMSSFLLSGNAHELVCSTINNSLRFEVPYYVASPLCLLNEADTTDLYKLREHTMGVLLFAISSSKVESVTMDIFWSYGDDARASVFQGFPPMITKFRLPTDESAEYDFVEVQMDVVSNVVGSLGKMLLDPNRDNPTQESASSRMFLVQQSSMSVGNDQKDPSLPLTLQAHIQLPYLEGRVPQEDEMKISRMCEIEGLVDVFKWTKDDTVGKVLKSWVNGPMLEWKDYTTKVHSFRPVDVVDKTHIQLESKVLPPITVISSMYRFWRGEINFAIRVVGPTEAVGRLMIVYVPRILQIPTLDQAKSCYYQIYDLAETNRSWTFTPPYIFDRPCAARLFDLEEAQPFYPPGMCHLMVYNPLIPNSTIPNEVSIILSMAASPSFEVMVPAPSTFGLAYDRRVYIGASRDIVITPSSGYWPVYAGWWHEFADGSTSKYILRYGNVSDHIVQFREASNLVAGGHVYKTSASCLTKSPGGKIVDMSYLVLIKDSSGYIYGVPMFDYEEAETLANIAKTSTDLKAIAKYATTWVVDSDWWGRSTQIKWSRTDSVSDVIEVQMEVETQSLLDYMIPSRVTKAMDDLSVVAQVSTSAKATLEDVAKGFDITKQFGSAYQAILDVLLTLSHSLITPTVAHISLTVVQLFNRFCLITQSAIEPLSQLYTKIISKLSTVTVQNEDSEDILSSVEKATLTSIIVAGFFSVAGIVMKPMKGIPDFCTEMLKSLKNFSMTSNALSSFIKTNFEMFNKIWIWCSWKLFPQAYALKYVDDNASEYASWYHKVNNITNPNMKATYFRDPARVAEAYRLYYEGCVLNTRVRATKVSIHPISDAFKRISVLKNDLDAARLNPCIKHDPICIYAVGASGIGKSTVASSICLELLKLLSIKDSDPIFVRSSQTEFWNGYNNQPVIMYDDFGVTTSATDNAEVAELFCLKSRARFNANMAELKDKCIFGDPMIVYINSNRAYPKYNELAHAEALYRRRNILMAVRIKPGLEDTMRQDQEGTLRMKYHQIAFMPPADDKFQEKNIAETAWLNLDEEGIKAIKKKVDQYFKSENILYDQYMKQLTSYLQEGAMVGQESDEIVENYAKLVTSNGVRGDIAAKVILAISRNQISSNVAIGVLSNKLDHKVVFKDISIVEVQGLISPTVIRFKRGNNTYDISITKAHKAEEQFFDIRFEYLNKAKKNCKHIQIEPELWEYHNGLVATERDGVLEWRSADGEQIDATHCEGDCLLKEKIEMYNSVNNLQTVTVEDYIIIRNLEDSIKFHDGIEDYAMPPYFQNMQEESVIRDLIERIKQPFSTPLVKIFGTIANSKWFAIGTTILWVLGAFAMITGLVYCGASIVSMCKGSGNAIKYVERATVCSGLGTVTMNASTVGGVLSEASARSEDLQDKIVQKLVQGSKYAADKVKTAPISKQSLVQAIKGGVTVQSDQEDQLINILFKNTFFLSVVTPEQTYTGRCLGVCNRIALIPHHYVKMIPNKRTSSVIVRIKLATSEATFEINYENFKYYELVDSSLMFVDLVSGIQQFRDITNHFITAKEHCNVSRVCKFIEVNSKRVNVVEIDVDIVQDVVADEDDNIRLSGAKVAYTYGISGKGKCGSLLIDKYKSKIIAMHFAGYRNSDRGYAEVLSKELLDQIHKVVVTRDIIVPNIGCDVTQEVEHPLSDRNVVFCGTSTFKISTPVMSRLVPSEAYGIFDVRKEPPCLHIKDSRLTFPFDPMLESCKHHGEPVIEFPHYIIDIAVEDYKNLILSKCVPLLKPRIRSIKEAITGIDGIPYYDSINFNTGAGFPYTALSNKPGKHDFVKVDKSGNVELDDLLVSIMEIKSRMRSQQVIPCTIFIDTLKDQLIKPSKNRKPGGVRAFSQSPLDYTIQLRQCTLDFSAAYMSNRISLEHTVGINPDSIEWTQLLQKLLSKGSKFLTGDYSKFGDKLMPYCVKKVFSIIIEWYNKYDIDVENDLSIMCEESMNAYHYMKGCLYQVVCGMPSGNALTVIINSMVNSMYVRCVWLLAGYSMRDYYDNVCLYTNGDDIVMTVSDKYIQNFNNIVMQSILAEYNIKYTDASKSELSIREWCSLNEVEYLKRGFLNHPFRKDVWLAPLGVESVEECANWIWKKKGFEREATIEALDATIRMAWTRGPEYYNKICKKALKFSQSCGMILTVDTWDLLDKRVFEDESFRLVI